MFEYFFIPYNKNQNREMFHKWLNATTETMKSIDVYHISIHPLKCICQCLQSDMKTFSLHFLNIPISNVTTKTPMSFERFYNCRFSPVGISEMWFLESYELEMSPMKYVSTKIRFDWNETNIKVRCVGFVVYNVCSGTSKLQSWCNVENGTTNIMSPI